MNSFTIEGTIYTIVDNQDCYRIRIYKESKGHAKKGKKELSVWGYISFQSAHQDLARLHRHLSQGPGSCRLSIFTPNLLGVVGFPMEEDQSVCEGCSASSAPSIAPKRRVEDCSSKFAAGGGNASSKSKRVKKPPSGRAAKLQKKGWLKRYRLYFQSCKFATAKALSLEEWLSAEGAKGTDDNNHHHAKAVTLRDRMCREGVASKDAKVQVEERGQILVELVVRSLQFAGGGIEYGWG